MQEKNRISITTSIAPDNIDRQAKTVKSWIKLGFDVVSINCAEEIETLHRSFPNLCFVQAKRDARNVFGKPVIYLDDVFVTRAK